MDGVTAASSRARGEYISRINRVIDFIDSNLDRDLSLDDLAEVANLSKYHFHRIFGSLMGESLFRYLQRVRVEKAATLLLAHPETSITEIAYDCGFSSSVTFAKSFKEYFGIPASAWRKQKREGQPGDYSAETQNRRNTAQQREDGNIHSSTVNIEYRHGSQLWTVTTGGITHTVDVKDFPKMTVAYVRYIGPYKGDAALFERLFTTLCTWAGPRNLIHPPESTFLVIYHDDPEITGECKLRVSACLSVPEDTEVEGEIGKMTVPPGRYACAHFVLSASEYQQAWNWVYGSWLPQSGYAPDDRPCFELFPHAGSDCRADGKTLVDICVPVKPL